MSTNTPTNKKGSEEPLIDVPEDFDLSKAIHGQRSVTPEEERKRCPDCGSVSVCPRQPQKPDGSTAPYKYRCQQCSAYFNHPKTGGSAE